MTDHSLAHSTVLALYEQGYVRLLVNCQSQGVVSPFRDRGLTPFDLKPGNHQALEVTAEGVRVTLGFGGPLTRCVFPWSSIYAVINAQAEGVQQTGDGWIVRSGSRETVTRTGQVSLVAPPGFEALLTPEQRRARFIIHERDGSSRVAGPRKPKRPEPGTWGGELA